MVETFMGWMRRRGWAEVAVLAAALLGVAGFWALSAVASRTIDGSVGSFDNRALLALRRPGDLATPIGPEWTLTVARDLTALGGPTVLALLTAGLSGYLLFEGRRLLAGFVAASVVSGGIVSIVLKEMWNRPRPTLVPHLTSISDTSFPSGHSLLSSVTYFTLAALVALTTDRLRTQIYLIALAGLLAGLIGFSRVYLGVHYPTDVLAGWCAGVTWAIGCCLVARLVETRQRIALEKRTD